MTHSQPILQQITKEQLHCNYVCYSTYNNGVIKKETAVQLSNTKQIYGIIIQTKFKLPLL